MVIELTPKQAQIILDHILVSGRKPRVGFVSDFAKLLLEAIKEDKRVTITIEE